METKTLLVLIAGLFIAVLILLIVFRWYGTGIPVIGIVIDSIYKFFERSFWLTGNATEWPGWAE